MFRSPRAALDARRLLRVSISASAIAMLILSVGAAPAAAGPTVRARIHDGTLRVSGSPFGEQLALRLSPRDPNQLQVDIDDDGSADFTFDLGAFDAIDVATAGGDDKVRIDDVNGAFTTTKTTRIDGGRGNDVLIGGGGNETFVGGRGADFVDGNQGVDTAFLDAGDDTFVWDPGDGSDIVEGGSGTDDLVFNGAGGSEIMAATADHGRVLFTRNLGTIVMNLDDVEAIDVNALGGADAVTVNDVSGTDLTRVDVDLAAALGGSAGDQAADTVTIKGTAGDDAISATASGGAVEVAGLAAAVRITHAEPANDKLVIDSLGGVDDVAVDPGVNGLIQVSVP